MAGLLSVYGVNTQLELIGAGYCHLCDQAEEMLKQAGLAAAYIDISDDAVLFEKYRLRIPVLHRMDNNTELGWPFDRAAVLQFLL